METLIVQTKAKEQLAAIKAVIKALKIDFKSEKADTYDPEFVKEILCAREDIKNGKGVDFHTMKTHLIYRASIHQRSIIDTLLFDGV